MRRRNICIKIVLWLAILILFAVTVILIITKLAGDKKEWFYVGLDLIGFLVGLYETGWIVFMVNLWDEKSKIWVFKIQYFSYKFHILQIFDCQFFNIRVINIHYPYLRCNFLYKFDWLVKSHIYGSTSSILLSQPFK